jgi:SAM-dependent methyltransferase
MSLDLVGSFLYKLRIKTCLPHINGRLLDIGCGDNILVSKYVNGVGVDVYDFGGDALIVKDTAKLPFEDQSFKTITFLASLNHIPNRFDVLKEAYRLLAPGGKIIITMIPPFISRIWHFIRSPWDVDQKDRGMKEGEVFGITKNELLLLLKSSGFKFIKGKRFMLGVNLLVIATKE